MRVGQPGVERKQPGLGAVADQQQPARQASGTGIQHARVCHQHVEVQGRVSRRAGTLGGVVQQHGAEKGHRYADRADHDVFPGRFECRAGTAVSDQEGGDHRGGFDGDPDDADVVGAHRNNHRSKERGSQRPIHSGAACVGVTVGEFGIEVADAGPGGQGGNDSDDDQHGDGQRVDAQQPAQRELGPRPDTQPQRRAAPQHGYR